MVKLVADGSVSHFLVCGLLSLLNKVAEGMRRIRRRIIMCVG